MRLDKYLTENGIYKSRTRAVRAIEEGCVKVNGAVIEKPSFDVPENANVDALPDPLRYVSRGALKLLFAIDRYCLDTNGKMCLDIGASTGGFTQVLLEKGAARVVAVDVGEGQLDEIIKNDSRVINLEKTDVRKLGEEYKNSFDFVSCDCSFISLKLILGPAYNLMKQGADGVFLIKPQFEVGTGRGLRTKNGVVKDEKVRKNAVNDIVSFAEEIGFTVNSQIIESPIQGGDGNVEYLLKVTR